MRIGFSFLDRRMANSEWRVANSTISVPIRHPISDCCYSPFLAERTNLHLEGPGALRLLVELPIGVRDRGRWHQEIGIVERFLAPDLRTALAHPGGVDAGIDDEMRDMDVLRPELARHRLRHRTQAELGAGESGKAAAAAHRGGRAGEEDVAAS